MRKSWILTLSTLILSACQPSEPVEPLDPVAHAAVIDQWRADREAGLQSGDGWMSLAGLFWLEEGDSTFGADESNDIHFPNGKAPDFIGTFTPFRFRGPRPDQS